MSNIHSPSLSVGFAGTPEFAAAALESLLASGFNVPVVFTQPDRPAGRGMKLKASPVKELALSKGIRVLQPVSLRKGDEAMQALNLISGASDIPRLDVLVVAAYGLILPQTFLDAPRLGCLNIHASLLPRWRGAAPIHRAIEAGDSKTGVCIMQMEAGLDTGPVRLVREVPIADTETTGSLHDKLAQIGAQAIVEALHQIDSGKGLPCVAQPEEGVTYAEKISKSEAQIDWGLSAEQLSRQIRAFDPFPGSSTQFKGELVKCFGPSLSGLNESRQRPGTVLGVDAKGLHVQTGRGVLCVSTLQKAGSKRGEALQVALSLGLEPPVSFDV